MGLYHKIIKKCRPEGPHARTKPRVSPPPFVYALILYKSMAYDSVVAGVAFELMLQPIDNARVSARCVSGYQH